VRQFALLALVLLVLVPPSPSALQAQAGSGAPAAASAQRVRAQAGGQTSAPQQPIFRLSVSLVQLDVVVTDRHGRHVTNLGPGDFEVYQDGHPQPVTAVTYVDAQDDWVDTSGLPPLSAAALKPRDARRVMALVVDDQRMSLDSLAHARSGLKQFAEREFHSGDLAVLVTTSGMRHPPVLTFSPVVLKSAIDRLGYSLWGMRGASALDPVNDATDLVDGFDGYQERTFALSSLMRIEAVIEVLRTLPGRKSVTLVSEGFSVFGFGSDNVLIRDLVRHLVDSANRAGVVLYALDPRGLVVTGATAADSIRPGRGAELAAMRGAALRESQDGLRYLAGETGGFAVIDSNDLAGGLRKIVSDQSGYYLVGYQPEAGTLGADASGRFRRLKIKVKLHGLHVRTRSGFYGVASE
jgi:VWFA-related protein